MKDRNAPSHLECHTDTYEYLTKRGFKPKLHILDNECSKILEKFILSNDSKCQFVKADNHRVNAAERAIQTFKNHFIAGLCTIDPHFPMQLWCELLPQAELTTNLL